MTLHIVGIAGPKQHGKSYLGQMMMDLWRHGRHGYGGPPAECLYFADPLKEAAQVIWRFSNAQLYGDQKEVVDPRYGVTPRRIMQHLGTEHARDICPDIWIQNLQGRLEDLMGLEGHDTLIVIPDLRFRNEADAIREWSDAYPTKLVWVERKDGLPRDPKNHRSEPKGPEDLGGVDAEVRDLKVEEVPGRVAELFKAWGWR